MGRNTLTWIFIVLEMATALTKYGVYLMPIEMLLDFHYIDWTPTLMIVSALQLSFLMIPFLAFVSFLLKSRLTYLWLALFPIIAFVFGIVPIPFANHLYTSNVHLNSVFIGIIDILAAYVAWRLYKKDVRSNNALHPTSFVGGRP